VARIFILTLLTVLLTGAMGFSQTPATASASAPAAPTTTAAPAATPAKGTAAIEPQGYTYNPDGRRDPFVSLLRRGTTDAAQNGHRGAGLTGLTTSEISLRGTLKSDGAIVGIVQGADSKAYIVRAGDKLADGSIRSISPTDMVIVQQVSDPLALQKEREVRKLLRQTEEGK
jgi:Tfp pilus assembly protein PilP